jgi:hypothetical protein
MSTVLPFLSPYPFCNQQTKAPRPEHQSSWFWRSKAPRAGEAMQLRPKPPSKQSSAQPNPLACPLRPLLCQFFVFFC